MINSPLFKSIFRLLLSKHSPNIHEALFPYCSLTNSTGPVTSSPDPLHTHEHGATVSCQGCNNFRGSSQAHADPKLQPLWMENKLDIQPTQGQSHRPPVLLPGSYTAALQGKPASPSPSTGTPQVDVTTLGGSGKKPHSSSQEVMMPQTNSQVFPGQGKSQESKRCHAIPQLMWCLFPHAAQAMRT